MQLTDNPLPDIIDDEAELDQLLAAPGPALVDFCARLTGDLAILGSSGKMGVSLAELAVNAARAARRPIRVLGVARFSEDGLRDRLERAGVQTIACDLLDPAAVARLPEVPHVIYMVGRKFGTGDRQDLTWAVNVLAPALAAEHFRRSRILAFSTGCVYPLVGAGTGGSREDDPMDAVGEYAQSCVGRERVFEYASRRHGTPVCLYRLNYATDLRYGVLHDIAARVWAGQPVSLNVGWFNTIWQGDANAVALRALDLAAAPPAALNVTGPELLSTRAVAGEFGRLMGRRVEFAGVEGDRNYLNNAARCHRRFGLPAVTAERLIRWQAHWIMRGGSTRDKPTHFEVSDGRF
jgi:hypothetical protein